MYIYIYMNLIYRTQPTADAHTNLIRQQNWVYVDLLLRGWLVRPLHWLSLGNGRTHWFLSYHNIIRIIIINYALTKNKLLTGSFNFFIFFLFSIFHLEKKNLKFVTKYICVYLNIYNGVKFQFLFLFFFFIFILYFIFLNKKKKWDVKIRKHLARNN